jgi:hypothetical protein
MAELLFHSSSIQSVKPLLHIVEVLQAENTDLQIPYLAHCVPTKHNPVPSTFPILIMRYSVQFYNVCLFSLPSRVPIPSSPPFTLPPMIPAHHFASRHSIFTSSSRSDYLILGRCYCEPPPAFITASVKASAHWHTTHASDSSYNTTHLTWHGSDPASVAILQAQQRQAQFVLSRQAEQPSVSPVCSDRSLLVQRLRQAFSR